MKIMAAQVNFVLFLDVFFLSGLQYDPEKWHICVSRGLISLHKAYTYALPIHLKSTAHHCFTYGKLGLINIPHFVTTPTQ